MYVYDIYNSKDIREVEIIYINSFCITGVVYSPRMIDNWGSVLTLVYRQKNFKMIPQIS
jgi:hypothetical protein